MVSIKYYFVYLFIVLISLSVKYDKVVLWYISKQLVTLVKCICTFPAMISAGCKTDSDCGGHGTCNQNSNKCRCTDGYTGNTCKVPGKCVCRNHSLTLPFDILDMVVKIYYVSMT